MPWTIPAHEASAVEAIDRGLMEGDLDVLADVPEPSQSAEHQGRTVGLNVDNKYVFNVARYGAWSTDKATVGKAIQAATDDAVEAKDAVVYFPPKGDNSRYVTDRPTVIAQDGDWDARVTFAGAAGRRGTRLQLADHDAPVFDFSTTGGNLRGITMRNLAIYDGATAIKMDKCAYLSFENLSFMQQYGYSIDALDSYDIAFTNGWWVHIIGDVASTVNGSLYFDGCHFGESAGSFISRGYMQINGGRIYQASTNLAPDGFKDMGREVFAVANGGQLHVSGANISGHVANLINADNADEISVKGCTIYAGEGPLVSVRRSDRGYPVAFQNNTVRFKKDAQLFKSHLGRDIGGLQYTGNTWLVDDAATVDLTLPAGSTDANNLEWNGEL